MTELRCRCGAYLELKDLELDEFDNEYPLMWFANFECTNEFCKRKYLITLKNEDMRTPQDLEKCYLENTGVN